MSEVENTGGVLGKSDVNLVEVRPIDPWKRERPGRAVHILPNHGDIAIKRDTETKEVFVVQEGPGLARSKIKLSTLTDLGRKWREEQREKDGIKTRAQRARMFSDHGFLPESAEPSGSVQCEQAAAPFDEAGTVGTPAASLDQPAEQHADS